MQGKLKNAAGKYVKAFSKPMFDIYMAVSYGSGVDIQESMIDKKKNLANVKRKKLVQWAQLCTTGRLDGELMQSEVYNTLGVCDESVYIELKEKYDNQTRNGSSVNVMNVINFAYPELYDIPSMDLDAASPFLENADTELKCINIAEKYETRRKLFDEYGWSEWIVPIYANSMQRGWKQEMGFTKPDRYTLNGEINCQQSCSEINGALVGVRFIDKGQKTGPAVKCESVLRKGGDEYVEDLANSGMSGSCPNDQETFLRDCFGGSCVDRLDEFAVECECQGWRKWIIADYKPRAMNWTEVRYLNKWDEMYGYDYNILYNGEVDCDRACKRTDDKVFYTGFLCKF